jgi:dihydrofolate reductase
LEVPDSALGAERVFFNSVENVKAYCANKFEELWVIGGAEIYKLFINDPIVDAIYLTKIPGDHECDTFFPDIPSSFTEKESIYICESVSASVFVRR